MYDRKNYFETVDIQKYRIIQHDLPQSFKMKILIAFCDGKPAAGVICSCIGDMGLYLFGATSNTGLTAQGSYVLQWKALSWLKENGAASYNLNGINPMANPGTYHFKSGMCGKNGKDVKHLGLYDAWNAVMIGKAFKFADIMRVKYRKNKEKLKTLRT
jgi:lipid II:glycine glycyltransferase (peptidoglycan interpeptide bridge formation enzyme)